ncbi:MAG: HD domain-containing protein [Candidatus Micrarchaeia archaeon]
MIWIKDGIHKTIELNDIERKIIDTSDFQRLHKIRQLALTYLVYPCATHTRFEHSLGTMHLCSSICKSLSLDFDLTQKLKLYALLHDIGHCAFSHESEKVLKKYFGTHERIGEEKIMKGEIKDIISQNYNPKEIINFSKNFYGRIIHSDIGADRMDYLLRDSHNTGVAYGIIDSDRIISKIFLNTRKRFFGIHIGGLEAVESLLVGRFMMYSTVYFHHTLRSASFMLKRAISLSIENEVLIPEEFKYLCDEDIFSRILFSKEKSSKTLIKRILKRDLFKVSNQIPYSEKIENNLEEIKNKIKNKFSGEFFFDIPEFFTELDRIHVMDKNQNIVNLDKISPLVFSLKSAESSRRSILLLCNKKDRKKLKEISDKILSKYN